MKKEITYDIQKNVADIINDLETFTKMHTRLDELSIQLSDVVYLASSPSEEKPSVKLMELVNVLLNRVELGIKDLEQRVSTIEDIKNRLGS
jgi:hypothetical protein